MATNPVYFSLLVLATICCLFQETSYCSLPLEATEQLEKGACPSTEVRAVTIDAIEEEVLSLLNSKVIPDLQSRPFRASLPSCSCGGAGLWTRIAHLDMSDPSQQCPSSWNLTTTPVRGCISSIASAHSCDSAIFPSNGQTYSHVCGRVNAYQQATNEAFYPALSRGQGLEGYYVDGVSLTHGAAGSRQHIWTFAVALYETDPNYDPEWNCACTNINENGPYHVPSFVGSNYFCDSGSPGPGYNLTRVYSEDPLWDGAGCGPTSTCCQFNTPPWFCTTLPEPTTDDLELRICRDQAPSNEDIIVSLVDINVM